MWLYLTKAMYYPYPAISQQSHLLSIPDHISPRPCTIRTQPYLTKAMYYPYPAISHQVHVLSIPDHISPRPCAICTRPYLTMVMYYLHSAIALHMTAYQVPMYPVVSCLPHTFWLSNSHLCQETDNREL